MKKYNFPFVASGLGLFLMLLVIKGGEARDDGVTAIPLLTLLVVSEFGFFVTAIGGYLGIRHCMAEGVKPLYAAITLLSILLSLRFLWLGIELWPN